MRVEGLYWEWGVYASEKNYNPKINLYLENQIYRYAKEVYENMNGINTAMLHEAYKLRFEEFTPNKDALKWIDKLRDYGMKTSFINSQLTHKQYYSYLKEVLEYWGDKD